MKTLEYKTINKSGWNRGAWDNEPDKRQWTDEETGLPCLIVRAGRMGYLCGYVGVASSHPWFGKSYDDRVPVPDRSAVAVGENPGIPLLAESMREDDGQRSLDVLLRVHGGLTFADTCRPVSKEIWEQWRTRVRSRADEAKKYPHGDAANDLRDYAPMLDDYGAWLKHCEAAHICHLVEDGEDDRVWWFGFDCAHCDDRSPGGERNEWRSPPHGEYRDFNYVAAQCAELAKQLKSHSTV